MGIDPDPRTLRELVWMADARGRAEWGRVLSLMVCVRTVLGEHRPDPLDLVPERYHPQPDDGGPRERKDWRPVDAFLTTLGGG